MTTNTTQPESGEAKKRSRIWILLLLLLLIVAGAVYWVYFRGTTEVGDDGEFRTTFEGCDDSGACATFSLYAPGRAYSWQYRRAVPTDIATEDEAFGAKIADDLRSADTVLVAGLASQEGGERFNERLATCRARAFEGIVIDAREDAGANAPIFRVALGQYQADDDAPAASTASVAGGQGEATQIQRVMVLAFVSDIPEEINLGEALRNGADAALTNALALLENEDGLVAEQLQFQRYSCWNELEATPLGGYARACYSENPSLIDTLCSPFN